ncbi:hypothetical protein GCM10010360_40260 [Streptomyces nogalater]
MLRSTTLPYATAVGERPSTTMLTQVTERLKFLVAFRPGQIGPTLSAQMARPTNGSRSEGCC